MRVRALDSVGDWIFGKGLQSYKVDAEALKQNVSTRLKSWKGDCFYSVDDGVDWNNYLDIGTKPLLDLDIKRVILQTGGVLKISSYSSILDHDTRRVTIEATIETVFGTIELNEVV